MAHTQPTTQTQHTQLEDTQDTQDTEHTEDTEDTAALRTTWLAEQARVRERVVEADSCSGLAGDTWSYVGGLDISFIVGDDQGHPFTQIMNECPISELTFVSSVQIWICCEV